MNWAQHVAKWTTCTKCKLCETRTKVVLGRGTIPAPVLFIGEAPGHSEDCFGKPFWGPAGDLLQQIIDVGLGGCHDYCLTNLIACIPIDEDEGGNKKAGEPPEFAIKACYERLKEVIEICQPKAIVCVGKFAETWGPKQFIDWTGQWHHILHPAFILRLGDTEQPLAIKRCVATLEEVALFLSREATV